jgi:hypothetical protein
MAFSSGSLRDLYYARETSYGVPPVTLTMAEIRNTEDSLNLSRDNFVSDERRGDRGIHDMRLGNKQPAGDINFELSFDAFDDFMASALGADFTASSISIVDESSTVNSATATITAAGATFLTDGLHIGDVVTISGFSDPENNGNFLILDLTETTLVLDTDALEDVAVAEDATFSLSTAWVAPYTDKVVAVVADADDKTFTRATGSFITDGFRVGDVIITTDFDEEAGNNLKTQITALTATVMTVRDDISDATSDEGTFNTTARIIKKGTSFQSFCIEKAFTDITQYQLYKGGLINGFSLDINPNAMITGSFSFLFNDAENGGSAYHDGTPSSVSTNRPFDSFTGYINEAGVANTQTSAFSFSLDNGFERNFVLMDVVAPQVTSGKSNVTGSVTLYFADSSVYNKFVNETESNIEVALQDDMYNGYIFTLPRIKYTSADTPVNSDVAIINTMNYQALDDPTEASNIVIRRQPYVI